MDEKIKELVALLEAEWSEPDGFLAKAREGAFDPQQGEDFLRKIRALHLANNTHIEKRLVSLLWYIPLFLSWQTDRVRSKGGECLAFEKLQNRILAAIEEVLGVP